MKSFLRNAPCRHATVHHSKKNETRKCYVQNGRIFGQRGGDNFIKFANGTIFVSNRHSRMALNGAPSHEGKTNFSDRVLSSIHSQCMPHELQTTNDASRTARKLNNNAIKQLYI